MKQYIVDAFTDSVFHGNQAAVCIMTEWPEDVLMQNIARENNFSETAFAVREEGGYHLRWFTPGGEIDFCGHATLGTAFVILNYYEKIIPSVSFRTQVGKLPARRSGDAIEMDFPAYSLWATEVTDQMEKAIGIRPLEAYLDRDLMLVLPDADSVEKLRPDFAKLKELDGLLVSVTAPGREGEYDCVSRTFAPKLNVPEDPVTGSAHCMIVPYWSRRLGKEKLVCYQASERSGILYAQLHGDRVTIAGKCALYAVGTILEEQDEELDGRYLGGQNSPLPLQKDSKMEI